MMDAFTIIVLGSKYDRDSDTVSVTTTIYPANEMGADIAESLLHTYRNVADVTGALEQNMSVPEVTNTNKTAVELTIWCRKPEPELDAERIFIALVSYYSAAAHARQTANVRRQTAEAK